MAKNKMKKPLAAAIGAAFVTTLSAAPVTQASENPFAATSLSSGYMVADKGMEGKCGGQAQPKAAEGKCGGQAEPKAAEGKCGGAQPKAAEGKCGGEQPKAKEGKCGEGKCGGKK